MLLESLDGMLDGVLDSSYLDLQHLRWVELRLPVLVERLHQRQCLVTHLRTERAMQFLTKCLMESSMPPDLVIVKDAVIKIVLVNEIDGQQLLAVLLQHFAQLVDADLTEYSIK